MSISKALILIIAIIGIMIAACSENGKFAAPDDAASWRNAKNNPATSHTISNYMETRDLPLPLITLEGTLRKINGTDGCYYLEPFQGEFPHELDFSYCNSSARTLTTDCRVEVFGRFNPRYFSQCVGGVPFQVYEIAYLGQDSHSIPVNEVETMHKSNSRFDEELVDSEFVGCCLTYQGVYGHEECGCSSLEIIEDENSKAKGRVIELTFQEIEKPIIPDGSVLEIFGNFRLFDKSPCELGPLFNVIVYEILERKDILENPPSEVCLD